MAVKAARLGSSCARKWRSLEGVGAIVAFERDALPRYRFSIDTLVEMLSRGGADVTVNVRRRKDAA